MSNNSSHVISRSLINVALLLSIFISWPIFFDLKKMVWIVSDTPFVFDVEVPIPIGFVAVFIQFIIFYSVGIFEREKIVTVFKPAPLFVFTFCVIGPLAIYFILISELGLSRVAQMLAPVIGLSLAALPKERQDQNKYILIYLLGFCIWGALHMASMLLFGDPEVLDENSFAMFFGQAIYQSHVSYPGGVSLILLLAVGCLVNSASLSYGMKIVAVSASIISISLLSYAARKISVFEILVVFFSAALIWLGAKAFGRNREKKRVVLVIALLIFSLIYVIDSPLVERFVEGLEGGNFSSGREGIYKQAIITLTSDLGGFFWGFGGSNVVGFHNYFLDTVYRVGAISFVVYFLIFLYVSWRFVNKIGQGVRFKGGAIISSLALIVMLVLQSLVNSPLTQPYYIANLWVVAFGSIIFLYGTVSSGKRNG